jgi:hypothetical protein
LRKLADVCVTVVHGPPVTVVRAHEFFTGYIESEEDIETAVKALREYLESLLKEGTRIRVE